MINQETKLPYVHFDHSDTRIRQAQFVYKPDWRWDYVELLKTGDYKGAELIRRLNGLITRK